MNGSPPSSLCICLRFGLDRLSCWSASFQTSPRTSEKAKVPSNKRSGTDEEVHGAVVDPCVVCIKAREGWAGRIVPHVLATIVLTPRDSLSVPLDGGIDHPISANRQQCRRKRWLEGCEREDHGSNLHSSRQLCFCRNPSCRKGSGGEGRGRSFGAAGHH